MDNVECIIYNENFSLRRNLRRDFLLDYSPAFFFVVLMMDVSSLMSSVQSALMLSN